MCYLKRMSNRLLLEEYRQVGIICRILTVEWCCNGFHDRTASEFSSWSFQCGSFTWVEMGADLTGGQAEGPDEGAGGSPCDFYLSLKFSSLRSSVGDLENQVWSFLLENTPQWGASQDETWLSSKCPWCWKKSRIWVLLSDGAGRPQCQNAGDFSYCCCSPLKNTGNKTRIWSWFWEPLNWVIILCSIWEALDQVIPNIQMELTVAWTPKACTWFPSTLIGLILFFLGLHFL